MARQKDPQGCGILLVGVPLISAYVWLSDKWGYGLTTALAVGVLLLIGLLYGAVQQQHTVRTQSAQALEERLNNVHAMSGAQFEQFVADVLRAMGYSATVLGGSGDQGVDIVATDEATRIAVQCKNYSKAVGNAPVQQVYSGAIYHNCAECWVVAPAGYTKGATELAARCKVSLHDASSLKAWIKAVDEAKLASASPA